jgi:hypothetical protein
MSDIQLRAALQHMDEGLPFTATFVTMDLHRNKGGKIINILHAKCIGRDKINGTFRFKCNGAQQIREGHIRLITKFNNHNVTW